jgi:Zn-dependent protease/predicted transcriptional regulator
MGDSIVLGRILGIQIGINWSWLLIAGLLVWTLAGSVFPSTNPDLSSGAYLAMAVAAALLFFLSILLHELGHAVQARRDHVEIAGITLWMLGGVAKIAGRVPSAGVELRIAIAGPLVSLVLGLAFAGAAVALPLPEQVDAVAAWLGYVNLALLIFNLVPAFPLDGGRILLAVLWLASGDFARSSRRAVAVSRVAAFGMMAFGVVLVIRGDVTGGVWLGFIGWFLLQAAGGEASQRRAEARLGDLRVRDLMSADPVVVRPEMTLSGVADEIGWRGFTTYPVVENGHPVGLLPFAALAAVPRSAWDAARVEQCMLPLSRVVVLHPETTALESASLVAASDVKRALVVDDGHLAGILSPADLERALDSDDPGAR